LDRFVNFVIIVFFDKAFHAFIGLKIGIVLSFLFFYEIGQAQNDVIKVQGQLVDLQGVTQFNKVMVINRRTSNGVFGSLSGYFTISLNRSDTISIHALGYSPARLCFRDSSSNISEYTIEVKMYRLNIRLDEIVFVAPRNLDQIQKDIDKLGYKKTYKETSEVSDVLQSPITALYERFSRFEKQKAEARRLQNESNRKKLLKELFRIYVTAEIIDLEDWEFDDFINYCNFEDDYIKASTQYELVIAIKKKYDRYIEVRKY
jgi:hypothetical protein